MRRKITYCDDIIVGVIRFGEFRWYASEKEIWILNQVTWGEFFSDVGDPCPDGFADRFGIGVVDGTTCDQFLSCMKGDLISTQELAAMFGKIDTNDAGSHLHLIPSLFVDFDENSLISYFPEPLQFERFIPDGWTSSYQNFDDRIPEQHRYWL